MAVKPLSAITSQPVVCAMHSISSTPGINGLTGPDRDIVRNLVSFFELARSVRPA